MLKNNLDNLAFYFTSEQIGLFSNTTFGNYLNDEASIFEKLIFKNK